MLSIDKVIEVVKRWCNNRGPGFIYRLSRCLDISFDIDDLKKELEEEDKKQNNGLKIIETTGYAADVDDTLVVECNYDYPNEWKDGKLKIKKVKITIEPVEDDQDTTN